MTHASILKNKRKAVKIRDDLVLEHWVEDIEDLITDLKKALE
jgi:cystathionine beta-lyase/cystathionine gamma-synthase